MVTVYYEVLGSLALDLRVKDKFVCHGKSPDVQKQTSLIECYLFEIDILFWRDTDYRMVLCYFSKLLRRRITFGI